MKKTMLIAFLTMICGGVAMAEPTLAPDTVVAAPAPIGLSVSPVQVGQMTMPNFSYERVSGERIRDLPLLPYGSFFVTLTNTTALPITVGPNELSLVAQGKTLHPMANRSAVERRWLADAYDDNQFGLHGRLIVHDDQRDAHRSLDVMTDRVVVPANGTWNGFVVFDVGERSADSWTSFVQKARYVDVELTLPGIECSTTFAAPTFTQS